MADAGGLDLNALLQGILSQGSQQQNGSSGCTQDGSASCQQSGSASCQQDGSASCSQSDCAEGADSAGQDESDGSTANGTPFPDPALLAVLMQLLSQTGEEDKNTALLTALKPHLRPENREKADRAAHFLKLLNILSVLQGSGLLNNLFR